MKILVSFSGGKDSQAALIWAANEYGVNNIEAVFCDTGWEHNHTYKHIIDTCSLMNVKLTILKSKKYDGFIDLAIKRKRFPSTKRRFCTVELKLIPMIDYLLELQTNVLIIEGIRKNESEARSKMNNQCTFFKYYFQPYKQDENGKDVFFTYRKNDVVKFNNNYIHDILRPHFDKSPEFVLNYILEYNQKPNPLYYKGFSRVGCFPCINCNLHELSAMVKYFPAEIDKIIELEQYVSSNIPRGSTFFSPNKIPNWAKRKGQNIVSFEDVVNYVKAKNSTGNLFEKNGDDQNSSCMSFYRICE